MPLPRRSGYSGYSPLIDCEYKPCYNDKICCSAPKPFRDKYCEEQKIWKQVNCCPPPKKSCCFQRDKTEEICSRVRNFPNWSCVRDRNYKENNKTMQSLTTCMPRKCNTRNCSGPYYSLKGPVYHPPGMRCQDYSLYIPTERVLAHYKCRSNHQCLKMKKPRMLDNFNNNNYCCIPPCCLESSYYSPPNQPQEDTVNNVVSQLTGQQGQNQNSDNNNNGDNFLNGEKQQSPQFQSQQEGQIINEDTNTCDQQEEEEQQQCQNESNDGNPKEVQCDSMEGKQTQMDYWLEEFKHKWNDTDNNKSKNKKCNPEDKKSELSLKNIADITIIQIPLGEAAPKKEEENNNNCNCPSCNRQGEIKFNGNHFTNCTCCMCQKRRGNGGYVAPKITDRKADRCKKLWFDKQRDPCHINPDNSDKTILQTLKDLRSDEPIECNKTSTCPCPKCCKQRQYARIKPHHWYSNGLTNPAVDLKKMYFTGSEDKNEAPEEDLNESNARNNNIYNSNSETLNNTISNSSSRTKSKPGSGAITPVAGRSFNPSSTTSETTYPYQSNSSDRSNNNISWKDRPKGDKGIVVDETKCVYDEDQVPNMEYDTRDCQRENPSRKSFGLDVTYRQLQEQQCCNNCYCCNEYQDNPCDDSYETDLNYPNVHQAPMDPSSPVVNSRRWTRRKRKPAPVALPATEDVDEGGDGEESPPAPNDYNTTVYRESYRKRCIGAKGGKTIRGKGKDNKAPINNQDPDSSGDFPADDDGWCCGKPRYRRGQTFDEGCQNHLLHPNTFSIFDNMFAGGGRGSSCKKCEEECLVRTCHDKQCKMPNSMEMRKMRWPAEDDGIPMCSCECGMLDRYCNACQ